jgi:hypothetical protein
MSQTLLWTFASAVSACILTYIYTSALGKANNVAAKSAFKVGTIVLLGNFIVNHIMAANRVSAFPAADAGLRFHASDPF